jgi:hypothetical protein
VNEWGFWFPENFPTPVIIDTIFDGSKYVAVLPKKSKTAKRVLPKGFKGFKSAQAGDIETLQKDAQQRSSKEIRFKDKEAVTIRFLEEPEKWHRFDEHYINGDGGGFVPCIGDGCPLDNDPNSRATRRWLANVVDVGSGEVRLLKMTRALVETFVLKYQRAKGTLKKRNYTITRLGGGTDTKYDVENEDTGPLEIGGREVNLKKLKLIDVDVELTERIQRFFGGATTGKAKTGKGADDDEDEDDYEEDEEDTDDEEDESDEDEDEEDEEEDDEDEDDDEDDEVDDEDEEEEPKRKVVKKKPLPVAKKPKKKVRR